MQDQRVLFGAASPIVVDYEEALARLSFSLLAAISVGGTSRVIERSKLITLDDCTPMHRTAQFLPCAFSPKRRYELCEQAMKMGFHLAPPLVDATAVVATSSRIGDGTFVNALATVGGASIIGKCVLLNRTASIGHHTLISDFASIAPGATVAGNVRIGHSATIGVGATILPDVKIGPRAIVAGGAVVRHDVIEDTVVAGNPASELDLQPDQTQIWRTVQE